MLEWFSTNGNELIIAVMTVITSGFVALYLTPNPFRRRKVYKSKKARLQAKLDQHQSDQKDPSSLLVEIMLVIVLYIVLILMAYPFALIIILVDTYFVNFVPESLPAGRPLVTLIWYPINCLLILTFFVPALKRLFFLKLPDFRTNQLKRRIRRIEDDENLLP